MMKFRKSFLVTISSLAASFHCASDRLRQPERTEYIRHRPGGL